MSLTHLRKLQEYCGVLYPGSNLLDPFTRGCKAATGLCTVRILKFLCDVGRTGALGATVEKIFGGFDK